MYKSFSEQVDVSFKDLQRYSDDQIKLLAKQLRIQISNHTSKRELCRELAHKLIYVNSNKIPKDTCSRYSKKITKKDLDHIHTVMYKEFYRFKDAVGDMSSKDLHKMFTRYDKLCFNGDVENYIQKANFSLRFRTNGEDTFTTEGICTQKICNYTVTIPTHYFANIGKVTIVAGHPCKDQLDCLLRVMEHELVHLIIFMFCGDFFITDQHGELFMNIARDLFGHTDFRHYIF